MGMAAILVMLPTSCHQIFIALYLKVFIKNLVQIGKAVSEKIRFEFLYVHDLGPRSRNDIDLQYSQTFIQFSFIFHREQYLPHLFTLLIVQYFGQRPFSRRNMYFKSHYIFTVHHFLLVYQSPGASIPSFVVIGLPVPKKKIFEGNLPYRGVAVILVM